MNDPSGWWQSFIVIWGPWMLILALPSIGACVLVVLARSFFLRRHENRAILTMFASIACCALALADMFAVAFSFDRSGPPGKNAFFALLGALLLIASLLGFVGFGSYTLWRALKSREPAPDMSVR